jgi:hypothetical protein
MKDTALFVDVTDHTRNKDLQGKDKLIAEMFEASGLLILSVCCGKNI